ncbi:uncharacterized protein EDB91DRAFT_1041441 [Suillus paluster]|uniref:uncharacterized protein n=1 Tax=Suillus paluster TaxID=48578 RepID=UPI001B85CEF0|nr:uncharacterized protein EDB91DRAFT_1041441 [Suillus paluster]KAG1756347.1 hypothetical protein EDB91DRAFT_1041441 [Suillus paluster]
MTQLHPSLTTLQVTVTTFHILAIIITTFRLAYRQSRHQLWWDDALTAAAMITGAITLVAYHESDQVRVAARWCTIVFFTTCLWLSRLSIVFSIIRLAPREDRMRRIAQWAAIIFAALCVMMLAQKSYICAHSNHQERIDCVLGSSVAAAQLATDFVSDITLVLMPIRLLREIHLPKDQRVLVISVFSTGIIVSLASIVHVVFVVQLDVYMQSITAQVELALSLIVCNLLVIVTYIYKVFRCEDLDVDRTIWTSRTRTALFFTTFVDADQANSWACPEEVTRTDPAVGKLDWRNINSGCHSFAAAV